MRASLPASRLAACVALAFSAAVLVALPGEAAAPGVTNVRAAQRAESHLVDIYFDVTADVAPVAVAVEVSSNGGATYAVPAASFSGDVGSSVGLGVNKHIVWDAGADWDGQFSAHVKFKLTATDSVVWLGIGAWNS